MSADVSIVLVTYNSADWIERCFASIPTALGDRTAELIVVDNASADDSADRVAALRPDAVLVRNDKNVGFAAAVNQGAELATTPWVLLLNPDTEADTPAIDNLISFAERTPGHGLYGGRTIRPDGALEPSSCWALPTVWSSACFAFGFSAMFTHNPFFDPESMGRWQRDSVREVGMITGCLLLVSRDVWNELGGMDARYFVYGEDADFAARARARGYRPIITPDATIVHAIGASSSENSAKMVLLMSGKITYVRQHFGPVGGPFAMFLLRLGIALHALGARLTGRGTRWIGAWQRRKQWWNGYPTPPLVAPSTSA